MSYYNKLCMSITAVHNYGHKFKQQVTETRDSR